MKKLIFSFFVLGFLVFHVGAASAGACKVVPCNAWLNCIDPDDEKTKNLCVEQQLIARGYKNHSDLAEKFHKREMFGGCGDFAVCAEQDDGSCGWQEAAAEYPQCIAHPEKYNK